MNIFFLDIDPKKAAEYMCDKHIVKMIVESVQMLSNPYYYQLGIKKMSEVNDNNKDKVNKTWSGLPRQTPYRISFPGHPCSVWVSFSMSNWNWLLTHALELCNQYQLRYNKTHSILPNLLWMQQTPPNIPDIGLTPPAQAMPIKYKNTDVTIAYQDYYLGEKESFAKWKNGNIPYFWKLK